MIETNFDYVQQIWKSKLSLDDKKLSEIFEQLPHPKFADFGLNSLTFKSYKEGEAWQISSYNKIKDPSWPECFTYSDLQKLPKRIIDECKTVHGFDFEIYDAQTVTKERWDNYRSGTWPVWELVRYKNVVLDIKEYLQNKVVLDYAAHVGIISLMALHVGAKFVKTTNVRPEYVDLSNKLLDLSGHQDRFAAFNADIHDYENNRQICQGVDTVLLYGIMYHVHDHCEILNSITEARPKNIIIDTAVPNSIIDNIHPLMVWDTEKSDNVWNGWFNGQEIVAVGKPNFEWFKLYMAVKNYKSVYNANYFAHSTGRLEPPNKRRTIMVFECNDV